jgi:TolB-like protein
MQALRHIARELRRRRVYRAAGFYIVGAWVAVQVASALFEAFGTPETALRYVWIAAILLFPLVLVFAWFYEVTSAGIRRTADASADTDADLALRPADYSVLAALLVVGTIIAYPVLDNIFDAERESTIALHQEAGWNAIAVLPLESLSEEPEQEYFVSGMHDALIAGLSAISGLRVTSKTSTMRYRESAAGLPEIAEELGVASLVEGSVYKVDRRVRITIKLMDGRRDQNIWSQVFEEDIADVLSMQRDIAREVANQVQVSLTRDEEAALASTEQVDPDVYEAFLKGQFHVERYTPQDLALAEKYYSEALSKDPDHALAMLGLSRVCGFRAQAGVISPSEARETCLTLIERALELDDRLAPAYLGYARHMTWQQFNWEAAGLAFRRAIELNPSYAEARMFYSHFLTLTGKLKEGSEQMSIARSLDPLNPFVEALYGAQLMMIGDLHGCVDVIHRVHADYPGFGFGHLVVWQSYYGMGREAEAIAAAIRHFRITRGDPTGAEALESAYQAGDFAAAVAQAAKVLIEHQQTTHVPPINIAMLFEQAGFVEQAIDWYEIAFRNYDPTAPYMGVLVKSPEIHGHPRFIDLLSDMRLDHWASFFASVDYKKAPTN